ncbi:MAG: tRNA guanosine(34) transglycosylase Tgt [Candidatus Andersenbacteria bacterium]|nr:tRNA guanosine(34) transglycosylase Tgt [Candidatus Andersenbacteria bacterium]MBI3250993.1 tRNA guanosine(34) transglycosylase Tgt [Candidatus Andersenbacteria bacterium]
MFSFAVTKQLHAARLSRLSTPHGVIEGPFFQFVATRAAIRGMVFQEDLEKMKVQIVLANTYHLHLQPGEDIVAKAGGLHGFMQWSGPITTDSGGYQVFSLGNNVKLDSEGVTFRSHIDGTLLRLTPESAMDIQHKLGADIVMPLDVCTPFGATREEVAAAVEQTYVWAQRCAEAMQRFPANTQALYGIVQGGVYPDLRQQAAERMRELNFFGYSIGGELQEAGEKELEKVVKATIQHLPADKPRYLMGYGTPEDIVEAVRAGVDQFDCVLPIRNARHGQIMTDLNKEYVAECLQDPDKPIDPKKLYTKFDITKAPYRSDYSLFSPNHPIIQKSYTKAYVHHLLRAEGPSGLRLAVLHNIHFYEQLMREIRDVIRG